MISECHCIFQELTLILTGRCVCVEYLAQWGSQLKICKQKLCSKKIDLVKSVVILVHVREACVLSIPP